MNVSEANAVNVVCRALLGPIDGYAREVTQDDLVRALALLAENANKRLMAGFSGGLVVAYAADDRLALRVR